VWSTNIYFIIFSSDIEKKFAGVKFFRKGMKRKVRGHGWTHRKRSSKKRIAKSNVNENCSLPTFEERMQRPLHPQPFPSPSSSKTLSTEEIRRRLLEKFNYHSSQCYYFGIRRGCLACMGWRG
jgi:hypothetical protein